MAFLRARHSAPPSITLLAPCCSIVAGPGNLLLWTPPCRHPHDGADTAARGVLRRAYRASHRAAMLRTVRRTASKRLRCLRKTTAAAPTYVHRPGSAAVPQPGPSRQARSGGHQADGDPARSVARLFARRRSPGAGDRGAEDRAYDYTTKGNFVAVITNGTAILGSEIAARWAASR